MELGRRRAHLALSQHEMGLGEVSLEIAMRLFQNSGLYQSYLPYLNRLAREAASFGERRRVFLADRFGALHFLQPVLDGEPDAFFTNGDDEILQRLWAAE